MTEKKEIMMACQKTKKRGSNKGFDREKNHFPLGEVPVKIRSKKKQKVQCVTKKIFLPGNFTAWQ